MIGMVMRANHNPISRVGIGVPRLDVPEVCSRILLSGQRMQSSCVEDGLVHAVIDRCTLVGLLEVGGGRIQTG